jgi:squalene-hopene/tetraprenyl-beta-curcumene cyclase
MMFLPRWFYFNIYAMSSWTRTIVVPLSIFSAYRPVRRLPDELGIAELFVDPPHKPQWPHPPTRRWLTATNFFLAADQAIKLMERCGPRWLRQKAVRQASAWMREHFGDSDGVGAIFPPIIYTIISLHCLGYHHDSPEMIYALKQLDDLMIEESDTLRVQPCFSPVWDTALAMNALAITEQARGERWLGAERGIHHANGHGKVHPPRTPSCRDAIERAARWLLDREVRRPGDWSIANPGLEPGGWFFEYHNGFYPDTDDTAMVLMGLARSGQAWEQRPNGTGTEWQSEVARSGERSALSPSPTALPRSDSFTHRKPAVQRALNWLLHMQNRDGGWAAFDRNINRELLTKIPFADHNAMLDPSCPDITARVLEALGQYGYRVGQRPVDRAIAFIGRVQDPRGCWPGRWGVNYIYGTWQVLGGLWAVGYDMQQPLVRRAVAWLKSVQQACGGWGESCRSYDDPAYAGRGTPTASQTAWALLGLLAAGEHESDAVRAGVQHLLATQQTDGNWHEDEFTGTGFPKVFYLKYHLYRLYFPLMALARYQEATATKGELRAPTHRTRYADPIRV